jgi:hypothetical protein
MALGGPAPYLEGLPFYVLLSEQPSQRVIELACLYAGWPGVGVLAGLPHTISGVTYTDLGSHLLLAESREAAPLRGLALGSSPLLLSKMDWPFDWPPTATHICRIYQAATDVVCAKNQASYVIP